MKKKAKHQTVLVTGSAGFIGFHVARRLLSEGVEVIGLDNFNDYYDPRLKEDRNKILEKSKHFRLYRGNLEDMAFVKKIFSKHSITKICHLAAQAGVRYSITNPEVYIQSNLVGFFNIIECARAFGVKDIVYASSSSVYGNNEELPFSEKHATDHPISLYAATKRSNELMAYTYHHLFNLNLTGLRFFTVYGPYGRPDMAIFSFTQDIVKGKTIKLFNFGKMRRDFTYIDDIVDGIMKSLKKAYPYKVFNLGNNKPVTLEYFVACIEKELGKKAKKEYLPLQPGDVLETCADLKKSKKDLGYSPKTTIAKGIKKFVSWYKEYYAIPL